MREQLMSALTGLLAFGAIAFLLFLALGLFVFYWKAKIIAKIATKNIDKYASYIDKSKPIIDLARKKENVEENPAAKEKTDPQVKNYDVSLYPQRIINKSEENLFYALNKLIKNNCINAHVFAQVSYGEMIKCKGADSFAAFNTFNSRRADFVIVNSDFIPVVVIEYHGEGHYKGADMKRSEAVKEWACKLAGIDLLVIHYREKHEIDLKLEQSLLPLILRHNSASNTR